MRAMVSRSRPSRAMPVSISSTFARQTGSATGVWPVILCRAPVEPPGAGRHGDRDGDGAFGQAEPCRPVADRGRRTGKLGEGGVQGPQSRPRHGLQQLVRPSSASILRQPRQHADSVGPAAERELRRHAGHALGVLAHDLCGPQGRLAEHRRHLRRHHPHRHRRRRAQGHGRYDPRPCKEPGAQQTGVKRLQ